MTPSQLRALQQNISQHRPKWQSFSSNSSEGRKWEMDDKEIKNDLPGPVSHFSTQAFSPPLSSSLSYSHTHRLPLSLSFSLSLTLPLPTPCHPCCPSPSCSTDTWRLRMIIGAITHVTACPAFCGGSSICHCHFPKCSAIVLEIVCVRQEMPVTHFDKGASDVRALITQKNSSLMCPIMCPSKSHK